MRHPQAVAKILQRRIDTGQLHVDLTHWLLLECVALERTVAIVIDIACGCHPALCAAILEEAKRRLESEMTL